VTVASDVSFDKFGNEIYGISELLRYFGDVHDSLLIIADPTANYKKYISKNYPNLLCNGYFINEKINFHELLKISDVFIRNTSTDGDSLSLREAINLKINCYATRTFAKVNYSMALFNGVSFSSSLSYEKRKALFNTTDYVVFPKADVNYSSNNPLNPDGFGTAAFSNHNLLKFNLGVGIRFGEKFMSYPDLKINITFFSPTEGVNIAYRFRLDKNDFTPNRSELGFEIKKNAYNFSFDYVLLDEYISTEILENREQVNFEFFAQIDKHWSTSINLIQDLTDDSNKTRKGALNLTYTDECFTLGLGYQRKNLSYDGIEPDNQVFLIINFKNLGSI
jgi:hypothetical protein